MPKTPFRTPNDPLIVTPGDLIRGEDDTVGTAVLVRGGNSTGGNNVGGSLTVQGGAGNGTGAGGPTTLSAGVPGAGGAGAGVSILATSSLAVSGVGGSITAMAGDSTGVANAGSITLTPGVAGGSGADGLVVIGGSSALEFTETASVPGPAILATQGRIWVRNDSPNVLVFTDDTGVDTVLGAGGGGSSRIAQSGVPTDDLRFFIDFKNQSSWEPNQATTWVDTIASLSGTVTGTTITNSHLNFAAGTDRVDFGVLPSALEDMAAGGGTVCAWVRVESDGGGNFGRIVDTQGATTAEGWTIYVRDEGVDDLYQFSLQIGNSVGGPNVWETTTRFPLDAWTHIAVVFDTDTPAALPTFYVNGVEDTASVILNTGTGYGSDAGNNLLVGNRTALDRGFDGDIEIVTLYDTAKSALEVRDIYRSQSMRWGSLVGGLSATSNSGALETVQIRGADSTVPTLAGGNVLIQAGTNAAGVGNFRGGNLTMRAGSALANNGAGGAVLIEAGDANGINNADGGDVTINAGNAVNNQGQGGEVLIQGGDTLGAIATGGPVTIKGGQGSPITGRGGLVTVEGGDGAEGGGDVEINGGETQNTFQSRMGNITLQAGQPTSGGGFYEAGNVFIRAGTRFNTTDNQRGGSVEIVSGSTAQNNTDGGDITITAGNTNGFNFRRGGDVLITAGNEEGNGSGTSEGGDIRLTPGTTVSGGVTRAGSVQILGSGTLEFLERTAALITPAAGRGYLWLRNDSPNVLVFTDDSGTDFVLNTAGGVSLAATLTIGNETSGTDIVVSSTDDVAGEDSAVADGGGFTIRGGDFTGGAGNFDGGSLIIRGGESDGTVNGLRGGDVTVQGGAITGTAGGTTRAGDVFITGGDASGGGGLSDGGNVSIAGGASTDLPGDVTITGGASSGATGGDVTITSGEGAAGGTGGSVTITTDSGASGNFTYGSITIQTPDCVSTNNQISGDITIQAGQNGIRNVPGSDVLITAGDSFGGGANRAGDVVITAGDQNNAVSGGDGGDIILNPGSSANATAGEVRVNGKLTVTGLIDPTGVAYTEQASVPFSTTAGFGTVWVRNDSPNVLVFTNDAGDDHVLIHRVYWVGSCGLNDSGVETFLSIQGDGAVLASQGQQTYFHAPADMVRFKVELRSTVASPGGFPGNTTVRVYRNRSGTASATVGPVNISADTTYEWAFSTASIVAGDLFSIGITPTTGAGEFQVSIAFEYDWSTV